MATGIGDTLRTARREQGRTLADASAETRVRETYLAALEDEEFSAVGGNVYVKGFIRSYARYLGVDPDPLLDQFRAVHERPEDRATIAQQPLPPVGPVGPMGPMGGRRSPSRTLVVGGTLVGLLAVLGLIGLLGDNDQASAPLAPEPVAPRSAPLAPPDPLPTVPVPDVPPVVVDPQPFQGIVLELQVTGGASYIHTYAGQPAVDGVMQAGFSQTFRNGDAGQLALRIGDASSVRLVVNGRDLGSLGDRGDVVDVTCAVGQAECEIRKIAHR